MIDLRSEQIREKVNISQIYMAYIEAVARQNKYKGGMTWKTVSGKQYLYRRVNGAWKSLGVRSSETEKTYDVFIAGRAHAADRVAKLREQIDVGARFAKASLINRVPTTVSAIIRQIRKAGMMNSLSVIGTHAIYVYESLAGVMVMPELMATADVDFLWDNRVKMKWGSDVGINGFLSVLQKSDRSFEKTKQAFRAVNQDGFLVDLIIAEEKAMIASPHKQMGNAYDLKATEIGSLRWLIHSPKVEAVVIDAKGYPILMKSPDPRCFAIHKLWLSEQPTRSHEKSIRDREQAITIAEMIIQYMPQFRFSMEELKMFPKSIAQKGMDLSNNTVAPDPNDVY
jgi:hypothetical protein